ncbi:VanW family protein [Paucibacter sp. DJ1R-11]|uniref:VanW family protein n=1 Tax=Paucibacter sp. DJ1R-11 TaxID=2893556 RepID=UPI0021E4115C|nr:VanW family protein [Paucibacter sp. DJ1R-11]MCV2364795.1 VanW family protein [Paucibacter sp. DJ1R-11]
MSTAAQAPEFRPPSRRQAAWFWFRVWAHVLRRGLRNAADFSLRRHRPVSEQGWAEAPVLAEVRSPLWQDSAPEEFMLLAGKVENLRRAVPAFDGLYLSAGQTLSFWRQLGPPWRGRGFVPGREIREGCVVPTVAGGLCQLSNALARAARLAGFEFLERHGHSARAAAEPGFLAASMDRDDATVFWNYVDLRLRAPLDCRLELELSAEQLMVRIRARHSVDSAATPAARARSPRTLPLLPEAPPARGCLSCGEQRCFRHGRGPRPAPVAARRLVLLNQPGPELLQWLEGQAGWSEVQRWRPWQRAARRAAADPTSVTSLPWTLRLRLLALGLCRALALRLQLQAIWPRRAPPRQALMQWADEALARCYARHLRPEQRELLLDQSLLLPLAEAGALGGRRYEVWLNCLPMAELQDRLDQAAQRWPQDPNLRDFRLPLARAERELRALHGAAALWTSHAEVARLLRERHGLTVQLLPWLWKQELPHAPLRPGIAGPPRLALAGSALGRKGAWELAQVLRELGWPLRVLGSPLSDPALWAGLKVEHRSPDRSDALDGLDALLLPAYIEHAPRLLLRAHGLGLPLIVSPACGLPPGMAWAEVAAGDAAGLRAALLALATSLARP